ncbi:MAG TPA: HU family DNA-binding protein [Corynebacteriales bacterium]|nr:HU family DNA-binding protein [Mycobacteriales bacterium]
MNKADIVAELSRRMNIDQQTATSALENILDIIVRSVEKDESGTIMGFGTFERRDRAARVARNPHTGEAVPVAPTRVPMFRAGQYFRAVVRGDAELPETGISVKRVATNTFESNAANVAAAEKKGKGKKGDKAGKKNKKKDKKGKKKGKKKK